jgi:hypothetical protein
MEYKFKVFNVGCNILVREEIVTKQVKVKVTLRLTVSQSVCLGVEPNYGTFDQRFFSLFLFFFCLKVTVLSFIGAPSLTRGRVCHVSVFVFEVYSSIVVTCLRRYATSRKVAGSSPDEVIEFFFFKLT